MTNATARPTATPATTGGFDQKPRVARGKEWLLQLGLYVALILLVIAFSTMSPYFLSVRNFQNILLQVSVVGMVAIGQTFIITSGGIDLSVGSLLGLTGVIAGLVALDPGSGAVLPVVAAICAGAVAGGFNGAVITRFKIPPFIVTLATLSAFRGIALIITDAQNLFGLNESFRWIGAGSILGAPVLVWMFLTLFAVAYVFQQHTRFARHVYAIGGDRHASSLFGVPVRRVEILLYTISGAIAGLAGAALAARVASAEPTAGTGFELTAIAAVIIGGTSLSGGEGGVQRTFVGVLILGVIANGLNLMAVPSYYQQVISGGIILFAVILDQLGKQRR